MDFLFDIGNVILKFDFSIAIQRLRDGMTDASLDPLEAINEIKQDLEAGKLDDESFVNQSIEVLGFNGSREEFARIWCEIFEPNDPMVEVIDRLAADHHRLYLLSNTSGLHKDYFFESYPVFRQFLDGVYSYSAQSMKPEEAIYRNAFDSFSLNPAETIYVDDLGANIATGNSLGLKTIHYDPARHEEALQQFAEHGVPVA